MFAFLITQLASWFTVGEGAPLAQWFKRRPTDLVVPV